MSFLILSESHLLAAVGGVVGASLPQYVSMPGDQLEDRPLLQLGEVLGSLLVPAARS